MFAISLRDTMQARFGPNIHKIFLCFALMTNLIVTSMLKLGGISSLSLSLSPSLPPPQFLALAPCCNHSYQKSYHVNLILLNFRYTTEV
jgi:hypothetical protein